MKLCNVRTAVLVVLVVSLAICSLLPASAGRLVRYDRSTGQIVALSATMPITVL